MEVLRNQVLGFVVKFEEKSWPFRPTCPSQDFKDSGLRMFRILKVPANRGLSF